MRNIVAKIVLASVIASLLAQPAYADKFVFYGGDDGHRGRHYHNHPRHHRAWTPYVERTYIRNHYYAQPYIQRSYYDDEPSYRAIRCTNSYNPLGMLLGGAAGGIVGNSIGKGHGRTAAVISGAVLGSAIGSGVYEQRCSEDVFEQTPVGMPINWADTNNDEYYAVTSTREYRTAGRYCREYQARATVGGHTRDTYGTACMQPDGSWEIVN